MSHDVPWAARRRLGAIVTILLLGGASVGLAACGGTDSDAKQSQSGGQAASSTSSAAPATTEAAAKYYAEYAHGKVGKADQSLPPVVLGWANDQGGTLVTNGEKDPTVGTNLAVQYINEHLGGIDGHPLVLKNCFVKNAEAEGLKCGQDFRNDPAVKAVVFGSLAVGAQTLEGANNGAKPIVASFSTCVCDLTAKNVFNLYVNGRFSSIASATYAKRALNAKTAALVYADQSGFNGDKITQWVQALKDAGVTPTAVGYDVNTSDLAGAMTAAKAQTADAVILSLDPGHCVAGERAVQQLGINQDKIVSEASCNQANLTKTFPSGDNPKWIYVQGGFSGDANLDTLPGVSWRSVLDDYDLTEKYSSNAWVTGMFGQMMTVAQILNPIAAKYGVEGLTGARISESLKDVKGPLLNGPKTPTCGKYTKWPALCSDGASFIKYVGGGKYTRDEATAWMEPPCKYQTRVGASFVSQPC